MNLFTLDFWFNVRAGALEGTMQNGLILFIIILAIIMVSAYLKGFKKTSSYSKIWKNVYSFSLTNLVISLLLLFFTYENIPLLSARFWFLLMVIEMIIWLINISKKFPLISLKKEELDKERELKKYIP